MSSWGFIAQKSNSQKADDPQSLMNGSRSSIFAWKKYDYYSSKVLVRYIIVKSFIKLGYTLFELFNGNQMGRTTTRNCTKNGKKEKQKQKKLD